MAAKRVDGGEAASAGTNPVVARTAVRNDDAMEQAIEPDDKDWTWVLERVCPECGFEAASTDAADVGALIRDNAHAFAELLGGDADQLRHRARPDRWSTLEYGAHVRDVYRLYLERLTMMLEQHDPLYPNWDQDATAVAERYNEQSPAVVADELVAAGGALADAFDALGPSAQPVWQRLGRRSDGASFTVDSFARYLIHDPIHHLWDVAR